MKAAPTTYFQGKVGILQRVLATYRKPLFDRLAREPGLSVSVAAGKPLASEAIPIETSLEHASLTHLENHYVRVPTGYVCWQKGVSGWLREVDPDVLVVEANPRLLSTWRLLGQWKARGKVVIGWGLGRLPRAGPRAVQEARQWLASGLVRQFDGMIAYGTKARDDYVAAGVEKHRIFIAYNSIDTEESEHYLRLLQDRSAWLDEWKQTTRLAPHLPIVLHVGRLVPGKDIDLLVAACAELHEQCQLLMVGEGPLKEALREQAQRLGVRATFTGYLSGAELARAFLGSDLYVLPGAGGLSTHQAMSYGRPVIVSHGDGTEPDLIQPGVQGLYFEPGSQPQLTAAITELLSDPLRRQSMGNAALTVIRDGRNLRTMAASFHDAIATTYDRSRGRSR